MHVHVSEEAVKCCHALSSVFCLIICSLFQNIGQTLRGLLASVDEICSQLPVENQKQVHFLSSAVYQHGSNDTKCRSK